MSGEYVLTIEAGGTKCEALLMTNAGEALGFHAVYPSQPSGAGDFGRGRDAKAALLAMRGVLQAVNPEGLVHLVTGSWPLHGDVRHTIRAERVMLWHAQEDEAALAWAGVAEGLVALAGTGAFGHLRADGKRWHADGIGPLIGDRGSAYQIGRDGLRAALRPGAATALRTELARVTGLPDARDGLVSGMITEGIRMLADRTAVADYAVMVDRVARTGDPDAVAILERAADDLAETLRYLVDQAGVAERALPLIGSGSVIRGSDIYWRRLVRTVARFLPGVRPLRQDLPQVAGRALAGAAQAIRAGAWSGDITRIRERLFETLSVLLAGLRKE